MTTHWAQGWISFERDNQVVVLYDESQRFCTHAVVELHLVQECDKPTDPVVPPDIQVIQSGYFCTSFQHSHRIATSQAI
jgi:hypothetical protein